jgi:plasminogen activator
MILNHDLFRVLVGVALASLISLQAPQASAQSLNKARAATQTFNDRLSVELYGGYLTGQSRELVFDSATGRKVSELFWKINGAAVIGGEIQVKPLDWLTFRLNGWTSAGSGKNKMEDYDWLIDPYTDWSDLSEHSDTRLKQSYQIDASFAVRVASFGRTPQFDAASVSVLAGFRWLSIGWVSYNGTFTQSSDPGFRDVTGTFQQAPVITYRQWMDTPYLGLGGTIAKDRWKLQGEVIGSLWAFGHDRDDHHLRSILFEDRFANMAMIAAKLAVDYRIDTRVAIVGRVEYQKYFEKKGSSTSLNYSNGTFQNAGPDSAGMDHHSLLLSLGLKAALY